MALLRAKGTRLKYVCSGVFAKTKNKSLHTSQVFQKMSGTYFDRHK